MAVCEVREPGGTHVGEQIRACLLAHSDEEMAPTCEMLLYMASRAQLVTQKILPALGAGQLVLADRFVPSTLAYQGAAGGIPEADIREVARIACGEVAPDLVLIYDVDERTALSRMNPLLDRMESKGREFHRRVREGYRRQADADPQRHALIDASRPADDVQRLTLQELRRRFAGAAVQR